MVADHDTYIAEAPEELRPLLIRLRAQLARTLPDAEEVIAYKMPGFRIGQSIIAGYAAFSKQCCLYPALPQSSRMPLDIGHALGAAQHIRPDSISADSTFWPASMHRPRKAWRTSRSTPCTGNEICTWAVGNARSAGFVRDFISVVPFFAC
jgi:hypothetical protein